MQDPPSIQKLLVAAREHLKTQVIPELEDPGIRFRTLVAANVLAIIERELDLDQEQSEAEYRRLAALLGEGSIDTSLKQLTHDLYDRVAAGEFDSGPAKQELMAHMMNTAIEKLRITNPQFLERVQSEDD